MIKTLRRFNPFKTKIIILVSPKIIRKLTIPFMGRIRQDVITNKKNVITNKLRGLKINSLLVDEAEYVEWNYEKQNKKN